MAAECWPVPSHTSADSDRWVRGDPPLCLGLTLRVHAWGAVRGYTRRGAWHAVRCMGVRAYMHVCMWRVCTYACVQVTQQLALHCRGPQKQLRAWCGSASMVWLCVRGVALHVWCGSACVVWLSVRGVAQRAW